MSDPAATPSTPTPLEGSLTPKPEPVPDEGRLDIIYLIARILQLIISIVLLGISGNMISDPSSLMQSVANLQPNPADNSSLTDLSVIRPPYDATSLNSLNIATSSVQLGSHVLIMIANFLRNQFSKSLFINTSGMHKRDMIQIALVGLSEITQVGLYASSFVYQVLEFASVDCSSTADLLDLYHLTSPLDDLNILNYYGVLGSDYLSSISGTDENLNITYIAAQSDSLLSMSADCGRKRGSIALSVIGLVCFIYTGVMSVIDYTLFHKDVNEKTKTLNLNLDPSDKTQIKVRNVGKTNMKAMIIGPNSLPKMYTKTEDLSSKAFVGVSYRSKYPFYVGIPRLRQKVYTGKFNNTNPDTSTDSEKEASSLTVTRHINSMHAESHLTTSPVPEPSLGAALHPEDVNDFMVWKALQMMNEK